MSSFTFATLNGFIIPQERYINFIPTKLCITVLTFLQNKTTSYLPAPLALEEIDLFSNRARLCNIISIRETFTKRKQN